MALPAMDPASLPASRRSLCRHGVSIEQRWKAAVIWTDRSWPGIVLSVYDPAFISALAAYLTEHKKHYRTLREGRVRLNNDTLNV